MEQNKLISFVIPCYRSENTIGCVIDEVISVVQSMDGYDYEIICVDDFSPDNVYDVICRYSHENSHIKGLRFARNFGQHAALLAGIKESSGDMVVTIDDDGQCPVDHIEEMIRPLEEGYDISFARYGIKAQSIVKNIGSAINEYTTNVLVNKPKDIQLSNFMVFKRFIADEVSKYEGPYPYLSGLLFRSGQRVINVPMKERKRIAGSTNYSFKRMVSLWVSGFTAFSIKPLRFATYMGLFIAACGILYGVIIFVRRLLLQQMSVPGWSSIIVLTSVLGGLILFVLGIIGEYIGRIYMTVNQTPQFVIEKHINCEEESDVRINR